MFKGKLYEGQTYAAEFLLNKRKVLLAHEQGLGKTIISLAAISKLFELGLAQNCLVLAPTSIAWQWEEKTREFTDIETLLVEASNKEARLYKTIQTLTIIPYSLFRMDYEQIQNLKFDVVIADEAQEFKNNQSKISKLLKEYNRKHDIKYRWALTGTAISNRLEELYSIFYWIDKDFLPPWPFFEKNHIIRNDYTKQIQTYKNLKGLNEHLKNRMDRKTHADMEGQLPELVHKFYQVKPTSSYIDADNELLTELSSLAEDLVFDEEGSLSGRGAAKVRRAFAKARREISLSKLDTASNILDNIWSDNPESKVVLFSHYKQPLHVLMDKYPSITTLFTGDQSSEEKQAAVQSFRENKRLLLCSDAGASGLDLYFARHIIHLDIPFSFSILDQRNKRITRLSSTYKTAVAHYLLMGIELYFYDQVLRKGMLASAALEGAHDIVDIKPQSLRQWMLDKK